MTRTAGPARVIVWCAIGVLGLFADGAGGAAAEPACASGQPDPATAKDDLAKAMAARDAEAITRQIGVLRCVFAGAAPERPERFSGPIPAEPALTASERATAITALWTSAEPRLWWTRPGGKPEPLRVVAEVIRGSLASWRISGRQNAGHLARATAAGDYLLGVQAEGGSGVFGFPLDPDPASENGKLADRFVREAKERGLLDRVTRNGWIIDDLGGGDLNYDNGLAGQALIELSRETGDSRYLKAARRAGDWAMSRPMAANFNYNGFTVALLANLFSATGDQRFLDEAILRAELGVLTGQIRQGPEAGSWIDPHNKRLVYRYIMIGQLADLVAAMPVDHPKRQPLLERMTEALLAAESQQRTAGGIGNVNAALVTTCKLRAVPGVKRRLAARNDNVEDWLIAFTNRSIRNGKPEAGPAGVGCLLELFSARDRRSQR